MRARRTLLAAAIACLFPMAAAAAPPESQAQPAKPHIAVVNGHKVTVEEYERAFAAVARQKFYHRTPPEGQVEQARRMLAETTDRPTAVLVFGDRGTAGLFDALREAELQVPRDMAVMAVDIPPTALGLAAVPITASMPVSVSDTPAPA